MGRRDVAPSGFRRSMLLLTLLGVALLSLSGCRSHAYTDVYVEKMAGEIRVLEDQLYQADYQNRILQEKLDRASRKSSTADSSDRAPSQKRREADERAGKPADAAEDAETTPRPLPPRRRDLDLPEIDLGEPAPPPGRETPPELPPGQIPLPEAVQLLPPPAPAEAVTLVVHPALSGPHHFEGDAEDAEDDEDSQGVYLVITPMDDQGRPASARGRLVVVLLDPARSGQEARLGRWEFDAQAAEELYRQGPAAGFHVPIRWQERRPSGKLVACFVRLEEEDGQRIEGELPIDLSQPRLAEWTPRAGAARVEP